jgi:hypothetical protein
VPLKSIRFVTAVAAGPALVGLVFPFRLAQDCRPDGAPWYAIAAGTAVVAISAVAAFGFTPQRWHWGVRLVPAALLGGVACFAAYVLWVWVWVEECSN